MSEHVEPCSGDLHPTPGGYADSIMNWQPTDYQPWRQEDLSAAAICSSIEKRGVGFDFGPKKTGRAILERAIP